MIGYCGECGARTTAPQDGRGFRYCPPCRVVEITRDRRNAQAARVWALWFGPPLVSVSDRGRA